MDENSINLTNVTVEDCVEAYRRKGMTVNLGNGHIIGFENSDIGYENTYDLYRNIFAY